MKTNSVLFSIRPQHAIKIFCGKKTVELRRVRPKKLKEGTLVFVYVSSPQKALWGGFRVAEVIQKPVLELWGSVKKKAYLSRKEYDEYFQGVFEGVAIFINEVWSLQEPIELVELKKRIRDFQPPQSFRYIRAEEIKVPLIHSIING